MINVFLKHSLWYECLSFISFCSCRIFVLSVLSLACNQGVDLWHSQGRAHPVHVSQLKFNSLDSGQFHSIRQHRSSDWLIFPHTADRRRKTRRKIVLPRKAHREKKLLPIHPPLSIILQSLLNLSQLQFRISNSHTL